MLLWTYITTQNLQILITEHLSTLTHQEAVNIFAKIYGGRNHYFLPYRYSLDINKVSRVTRCASWVMSKHRR